jgi:outer membrane protein assembly factor BamB
MLGVAHGNLICTGKQVVAIDIATGRLVWQWSDGSGLSGFGRGILAGDYVYYPTKTHIYILDQRTGVLAKPKVPLQELHNESPGNLVIGEGYLVVAQPKSLTVFCQYDVLINRYRDLIARDPQSAEPHFRLARAAEASGDAALAVEHYRTALELVSRTGPEGDSTIKHVARSQLYALLKQLGERAATERNWPDVDRAYREAAQIAPSSQRRLDALLRLAQLWRDAGEAATALATYQELLADDSLRGLAVQVERSRSVRADVEIAGRVHGLLDEFGRDIYARFEADAAQLFAEAQQNGSSAMIERLVRTYPNAKVVAAALLHAAGQLAADKQYAAACAAYRQLLARSDVPPAAQIAAVHGLAQVYESQHAWHAARTWWQRLAQDFPDAAMPNKPEQSVASFVAEHLSRPPFDGASAPDVERLQLPLARRWGRAWKESSRVIIPDGQYSPDPGLRLIVSAADSAECIAAQSGELLWTAKLLGPVRWAAFHEDHMLIGTDVQLARLDAATGEVLWQQKTNSGLPGFSEFRLVDDRVFMREESRKLHCVSAATGATQWTYSPTEGTILPNTFYSGQHVALRTQKPGKLVVLDGDGRLRFDINQPGDAWDRPPVAVDSHRVLVAADSRTIQLLDLNDGRPVWSYVALNSDHRPVPIVVPGGVLVLAGGSTLIRLNPEAGRAVWSVRVTDDVLPRTANVWTTDGERFYCITRELNLRAFRLKDGELEWQHMLTGPGDEWRVEATAGYVVALPRQSHKTEGLPVVFCRQSDGQLVQRLFFRPHESESLIHLARQQAVIGSEREVWTLASESRDAK